MPPLLQELGGVGCRKVDVAAARALYEGVIGLSLAAGRADGDVGVAWAADGICARWGRANPGWSRDCASISPPPSCCSRRRRRRRAAFVPYLSQGAEISSDYAVKNRISVIRSAAVLLSLLGLWVWLPAGQLRAGQGWDAGDPADDEGGWSGYPALLLIAGCFGIVGFPITRRRHAAIQRHLVRRGQVGQDMTSG